MHQNQDTDFLPGEVAQKMLAEVERFNREIVALPIPPKPQALRRERAAWAEAAMLEEVAEFKLAAARYDIAETADALIDLVYFALGRLIELGLSPSMVFEEVHKANMAKQRGELSKRPGAMGHDAIKPEGWKPPDHTRVLKLTMEDVQLADLARSMSPVMREAAEIRAKKGQDYNSGPKLTDYFPFGAKSYAQMVYMKTLRMMSLIANEEKGQVPNYEGLEDTLIDLLNYVCFFAEYVREAKRS